MQSFLKMFLLSFCSLRFQNKKIILENVQKFFSKSTYYKQLPSSERCLDNVKRYFMVTSVLVDDYENEKPQFFRPSRMMVKSDGTIVKKPKPTAPKILLHKPNGTIEKMFLVDAEKYAKRNNLILEKVEERAKLNVYRVIEKSTKYSNLENDETEVTHKKANKLIIIKVEMSENDIKTKINYAIKLLGKKKPVTINVIGNTQNSEKFNNINNMINDNIGRTYTFAEKKIHKTSCVYNVTPEIVNVEDEK